MNKKTNIVFLTFIVLLSFYSVSLALPAFPGAEGKGSAATGGRGGTVYIVDTLSDNPADGVTFREACEATGARFVTFAVSGIIELESILEINEPNLTIAGETSPGGIMIYNWQVKIQTNNIIIRHMRFRNGCGGCWDVDGTGVFCESNGDTLSIYAQPYAYPNPSSAYNIIIDHCSITWGCDETMDFAAERNGADYGTLNRVTISNSIIAQGVNDAHEETNHARGLFLWGAHTNPDNTTPVEVDFHGNFISDFYSRMPMANYDVKFDFTNNVVYNWNSVTGMTMNPVTESNSRKYYTRSNILSNYLKKGPNTNAAYANPGNTTGGRDVVVFFDGVGTSKGKVINTTTYPPYEMLHMSGNVGYTNDGGFFASMGWSPIEALPSVYEKTTRFKLTGVKPLVTPLIMTETIANTIVSDVGATKPFRDSVDTALIAEYTSGNTGSFINRADVASLLPTYSTPTPPTDSDSDGMPDSWEISQGLNSNDNDSALDKDNDGYTNIEEYLHFLSDARPSIESITIE